MRTLLIFFSIVMLMLASVHISFAQQLPATFESIKLNSAPAFVILGVEPENISRPGSPEQFVTGIQNAFQEGKLKTSFAMEFTPYFWKNPVKDPGRFSGLKYVMPERNVLMRIRKTLTFSLATSSTDTAVFGKLKPGTGIGLGVRFTLVDGKPKSKKVEDLLKWNELFVKLSFLRTLSTSFRFVSTKEDAVKKLEEEGDTFKDVTLKNGTFNLLPKEYSQKMIDEIVSEIKKVLNVSGLDAANALIATRTVEYNTGESTALQKINNKVLPFAQQGFMLEFAAGEAIVLQENKWEQSSHAKSAIWLTPSYRWDLADENETKISLLDLMGVCRYTFNNTGDSVDVSDYFDVGLKGKYSRDRFSAAIEGVYRYATDVNQEEVEKNYTYRATGTLEYRINDLLTLKATFGTNFNGNSATYTDPKEIFALAGLNVGLFNSK